MKINHIKYFRDPISGKPLIIKKDKSNGQKILNGALIDKTGTNEYKVKNGIINFVKTTEINGTDKEFNLKYEKDSKLYDEGMTWLFNSFFENEKDVRNKLIAPMKLKSKSFVLNVGCGTGSDSLFISKKLGNTGKLFNLDLSPGLLMQAVDKLKKSKATNEFIVGNASNLPFASNTFDAVFHFGGINMFTKKKKAIDEMVRVVKPNGRIVFGDESAPPWLRKKEFGKIIINANPLYRHTPPLELLPENAKNVCINYVLGSSFYLISFEKGKIAKLNLDLKIPGIRGGTLRTRYQNKNK